MVAHRNDPGLNIRVLNLSFGTDSLQDSRLDPLSHAVEAAWRKGIVVVVAVGNEGHTTTRVTMPAAVPTNATQTFPASTGLGPLDAARGGAHVADPVTGVELTGERDVMGQAWTPSRWATSCTAGTAWTGGTWNARTWSGSVWTGTSWTARTWSGATWSGSNWAGRTWSGQSWSGQSWSSVVWDGRTWSGRTWSGRTWSGRTWSGGSWAGAFWE